MSSEIVGSLLQWLNANPQLAGLVTFLISAAESVAIIGTIVPGSITMTAIGTLAGAGVIPLWGTIIWAMMGAILGDGISYWMGHYFKDQIRRMWPFKNNPGVLETGEKFVTKHGIMSVFIGRFVGPVRALVPLVAGMLGMRPLHFTIANVASAIGWAPAYMLPGILLGAASQELPPDIALHAILAFLLMIMFGVLCFWVAFKLLKLLHHQIDKLQHWILKRLSSSQTLSRLIIYIKHHQTNKTHRQLRWVMIFITSTFLLLLTACYIKWQGGPAFIAMNEITLHFFRSIHHENVNRFMLYLTLFGEVKVLLPVMLVLVLFTCCLRRFRVAAHLFSFTLLVIGSTEIIKRLFNTERPWGILVTPSGPSMPSGHTVLAVTFYFALAFLLSTDKRRLVKWVAYFAALLMAVSISVSRLYLSAHWLTDVFTGWLLGSAVLSLVLVSYQRKHEERLNPYALMLITALSLACSYSLYFHTHFKTLLKDFTQIDYPTVYVSKSEWWEKNNELPAYQVNLIGFPSQKINLAWSGELPAIKKTLMSQGWSPAPLRDWVSVLHRLSDVSSTQYLPLISQQYLDKPPALVLVKRDGKNLKYVLRLWDSNRIIQASHHQIWVGVLTTIPRSYSWILRKHAPVIVISPDLIFEKPSSVSETKIITMNLKVSKKKIIQTNILMVRSK